MLVYGYITLLLYSTNYDLVILSALHLFGYSRCHSVTVMLSELGLPCFDYLFSNCVNSFKSRWTSSKNVLVEHQSSLLYKCTLISLQICFVAVMFH